MYGLGAVGLGLIAALRHHIGAIYGIAYGVASTIIFAHALNFNRPFIDDRLALVAGTLALPVRDTGVLADAVIGEVRKLISELGLPNRMSEVGIPREGLKVIAEACIQDFIIQNNPKPITSTEQLLAVLEQAW